MFDKAFYIVETVKVGAITYTEFPNLFLTQELHLAVNFIKADTQNPAGFLKTNSDYHWYWRIVKIGLDSYKDDAYVVKVFDKFGNETTEESMLGLDEGAAGHA